MGNCGESSAPTKYAITFSYYGKWTKKMSLKDNIGQVFKSNEKAQFNSLPPMIMEDSQEAGFMSGGA